VVNDVWSGETGLKVSEDAPNDTVVGEFTTVDADPLDTHTYSFVATEGDARGRFKIVGDQLQVADTSLIDYETHTTHQITVQTTDNGGLSYDEIFTITVINVNDTPNGVKDWMLYSGD
jgi:hypothetical protein